MISLPLRAEYRRWPTLLLALSIGSFIAADPGPKPLHGEETAPGARVGSDEHPLAEPLRLIKARQEQIEREVRDFTCVLVKRERINGRLQEYQRMLVKVREGGAAEEGAYEVRLGESGPREKGEEASSAENSGAEEPLAIFLEYLAPARLEGRRVLFVEGCNNNRMLVRKGGPRLSDITVHVSLDSEMAKRESGNPITEISFNRLVAKLVERIEEAMQGDPTGENTQVESFDDVKINGRPCLCIRVTHPERQEGLRAHLTHVFIDKERQLPVRLEVYDWPESQDAEPPLLSEITYTDIKINVGLGNGDFDSSVVTTADKGESLADRVSRLVNAAK
jgi:hypothetical protein